MIRRRLGGVVDVISLDWSADMADPRERLGWDGPGKC